MFCSRSDRREGSTPTLLKSRCFQFALEKALLPEERSPRADFVDSWIGRSPTIPNGFPEDSPAIAALEPRSRRPKSSPARVAEEVVEQEIGVRAALQGLD